MEVKMRRQKRSQAATDTRDWSISQSAQTSAGGGAAGSQQLTAGDVLLSYFLQYCRVADPAGCAASDATSSAPNAMTFEDFTLFCEDSHLLDNIPNETVDQLLESIQPKPGCYIRFEDFCIILEIVAAQRAPSQPLDVAVSALIADALGALTFQQQQQFSEARSDGVAATGGDVSTATSSTRVSRSGAYMYMPSRLPQVLTVIQRFLSTSTPYDLSRILGFPAETRDCFPSQVKNEKELWMSFGAAGHVMYPNSHPAVAEELAFQMCLNRLDLLTGNMR